ncbi:spheroidene monooxygenase [Motilibacter rhizosphaerae]|uniref:Spheroidene monooxygenase n=1 Tax=Motilibacter rhizosphaerae TaxID=598652 RepID=A0A4Q7NG75_9ACTN|nr:monooxygenase [Motilibacter rhizosphaerae]RZS82937.1 spheroidene monooxygenase [Motilibacter rhizosphaerae]
MEPSAAVPSGAPAAPGAPHTTVHVWGVRPRDVPAALVRVGTDRRVLGRAVRTGTTTSGAPAPLFATLLGTSSAGFRLVDSDPAHWALLATWPDREAAEAGTATGPYAAWRRLAVEELRLDLRPLASRGRWGGAAPFGDPEPVRHDGPVAAVTRARLRARTALSFRRAVPPVARELAGAPGLRLALGVGEWPVGLQGTLSLWDASPSLVAFAGRTAAHVEAVRRTAAEGWYAEELFARFAVLGVAGTLHGRTP